MNKDQKELKLWEPLFESEQMLQTLLFAELLLCLIPSVLSFPSF